MMFWLLALVVLASLAGLGYRQGVVRVAFSFVGILLGTLLAGPLGKLVKPLLVVLGLKNPALAWVLAPLVAFVLISIIFKVAAHIVHQKVEVHFKYKSGDLRLALWERLSHRLGLCLGLFNGALYVILLSFVIYAFSYWTIQIATSSENPRSVRLLNALGRDLQSSGFVKVAGAVDPMTRVWYDSADLAGLIYNNPLSGARLARYPALLVLAERPEFLDMASDTQFTELLVARKPIQTVLDHPKAQAVLQNPDLLKLIWATVIPDLKDLSDFLASGKSAKYDQEKILGRWNFSLSVTANLLRRAKPNTTSKEMQKWKSWMAAAFAKTSFVAMTDHQALLKNVPQVRQPASAAPAGGPQTLRGQWKGEEGKYQLNLSGGNRDEQLNATVEGSRLTVSGEGMDLAFDRED